MATNVDVTTWNPPDSTIQFHGVNPTDEIHICDITDDTELYVLTGTGIKDFYVGDNYGRDVYFVRNNSSGRILMTTYPDTVTLKYGDNGSVDLYYGSEVQLANASDYVTAPDFPNYLDLGGILKPL
jgi:hypothetical protein